MDPRLASAGPAATVVSAPDVAWYRTITTQQWQVLVAAKFGWMLDAMDFMLYAMAIGQLRAYFGFDDATAGILGTVTLVMSGVGGLLFGYVADRFGRTRALMGTIALFSVASLGAATSQTVLQLLFWRALLGIGMGGEWASGAVLVSETWPAAHRNKAISIMQSGWALGYILAALLAAAILGQAVAGPARLAVALRRRRPAGPVHAVGSPARAGTRVVDQARRRTRTRRRTRSRRSSARRSWAARFASSCWARPRSSPTGACSSGSRRSWRARWRRAAPA